MTPQRRAHGRYRRAAFRTAVAFLRGRLAERATVEWALKLSPDAVDAREAVLDIIDAPDTRDLAEPWRTTWRLLEEAWCADPPIRSNLVDAQFLRDRVRAGERTGLLITAITRLVSPWLEVKSLTALDRIVRTPRRIPRTPHDLASISITSGDLIDPSELAIGEIDDLPFLMQISRSLDASLTHALDLGERIWGRADPLAAYHLGSVYRVYFVSPIDSGGDAGEPDRHHSGIAPLVKFQLAVAERIRDLSAASAAEIASHWRLRSTPIHQRMWAALARDARIATADAVAAWLLELEDTAFWDVGQYPEIAEIRAIRFGEFTEAHQAAVVARILHLPPRSSWPRGADRSRTVARRRMWAARELRRIQVAGASLPRSADQWLASALVEIPYLAEMTRVVDGFPEGATAAWRQTDPEESYDLLSSTVRLRALEAALSGSADGATADTVERARDWIKLPSSHVPIIVDLESTGDCGAAFPRVWEQLGRCHSPPPEAPDTRTRGEATNECMRILALLSTLNGAVIRQAIEGISHWLSRWVDYLLSDPSGFAVWFQVWPIAIEATNLVDRSHVITMSRHSPEHGLQQTESYFDAINNPTGRLVDVFLRACPRNPERGQAPEWPGSVLRMRDTLMSAHGTSRLVVLYRLIEWIDFFLRADPSWAHAHLVSPLGNDGHDTATLWDALAYRMRSRNVLSAVGNLMLARTTDTSLRRSTRGALVTNLIAECLLAYRDARAPVVALDSVQQMIRKLDDELRVGAAHVMRDFISFDPADAQMQPDDWTAAKLYQCAIEPFLASVWPQERSLVSPGVSEALAALPAATRGAFAAATAAVCRLLVPFECWSLHQFGLRTDRSECWSEAGVIDEPSAEALLTLLDCTIAAVEGTVVPHDLSMALEHIRATAPRLARTTEFRRLEAATRGN